MSARRIAFLSDTSSGAAQPALDALRDAGYEVLPIEAERPDAAARVVRDALRPKREPGASGAGDSAGGASEAGESGANAGDAKAALEAALAPHVERMRKMNLRTAFVAGLLERDAPLEPGAVAMEWAGMPNKHERALTLEVLEALADAGLLARESGGAYRVARTTG